MLKLFGRDGVFFLVPSIDVGFFKQLKQFFLLSVAGRKDLLKALINAVSLLT